MSAECDALMQKLNAIEAKLSAMDGKYIPKSEKQTIIDDSATKGKNLAKAAIVPLFGAYATKSLVDSKLAPVVDMAQFAKYKAEVANVAAQAATKEAVAAKIQAVASSKTAKQALSKVDEVFLFVRNQIKRIDGVLDVLGRKVGSAIASALSALGLSKAAQETAGKALKVGFQALGKVLLILDILSTIFSVLNAIDLRRRMNILEQKTSIIEREVSQILSTLFTLVTRIKNVQGLAEYANTIARAANSLANQANSTARQARSIANSALAQAAIAVTQIAIVAGVAAGAAGLARAANNRALQPGRQGKPGIQGLPGRQGMPGPAGRPGVNGKPGINGRNGVNGLRGVAGRNGLNGARGPQGRPGITTTAIARINSQSAATAKESAVNNALLKQIAARTNQISTTQAAHVSTSVATNAMVIQTRAYLTTMQTFAAKAWQSTRIQKVINALTLISVIHNAAMLSRFTGQTLLEALSGALDLFGIDDEEGNRLDLNGMLGRSVESLLKNVLGEEVYNDTSKAWQKANRVVQIGSNIVWSVRSIMDTSLELSEYIANNTGKIGNSLKRFGIVGENAFPDMSESARAQNKWRGKIDRYQQGLETVDNVADTIEYVTQTPLEIASELGEIQEQRLELEKTIVEAPPKDYPANEPIATVQAENKENSVGAEPTVEASQRSAS